MHLPSIFRRKHKVWTDKQLDKLSPEEAREVATRITKEIHLKEENIRKVLGFTKEKIIIAILGLNAMYILETDDGTPISEELLQTWDLDTLRQYYEEIIEELKKDVGDV